MLKNSSTQLLFLNIDWLNNLAAILTLLTHFREIERMYACVRDRYQIYIY